MKNKRNAIFSNIQQLFLKRYQHTPLSLEKAVKDGFAINPHVYKACNLIADNVALAPIVVVDGAGKHIKDHYLAKLINKPNKNQGKSEFIKLLTLFNQLTGDAYIYKTKSALDSKKTSALKLMSPDRISVLASVSDDRIVENYRLSKANDSFETLDPDDVIQVSLPNPANPILGLSPLVAAGMAIDLNNLITHHQLDVMSNGGNIAGILSVENGLTEEQQEQVKMSFLKRMKNKLMRNVPVILPAGAKFLSTQLTGKEIDFIQSSKASEIEIYNVFGIPSEMVSDEALKYSGSSNADRNFWIRKIVPFLNIVIDSLNSSFEDELNNNGRALKFAVDLTKIEALKESQDAIIDRVVKLAGVGVPMKNLNDRYKLDLDEYEGWDKSTNTSSNNTSTNDEDKKKRYKLISSNVRSVEDEVSKLDGLTEELANPIHDILKKQKINIDNYLNDNGFEDLNEAMLNDVLEVDFVELFEKSSLSIATQMASSVITTFDERDISGVIEEDPALLIAIDNSLKESAQILTTSSAINTNTVAKIIKQIKDSKKFNETIQQLKKRIQDVGAFSPERALTIARTESVGWASIGQEQGAIAGGATHKFWSTAGGKTVREEHKARNNERVEIEKPYSKQGFKKEIFRPGDKGASTSDIVNCRCTQYYEIDNS